MNKNERTVNPENNIGRIRATSISKTRKMTDTIKNFIQKGSRVTPLGSNPHSKGEAFSLSTTVLNVIKERATSTAATAAETHP